MNTVGHRSPPLRTDAFIILIASAALSTFTLAIERALGIPWNYHPDAETYIYTSTDVAAEIHSDWMSLFNNGYYLLVHFFGNSIEVATAVNVVIYALTNALIFTHLSKHTNSRALRLAAILLLLLNPYRLHLSTAVLKDTLIIFFAVCFATRATITLPITVFAATTLRLASLLYVLALVPTRIALLIAAIGCIAAGVYIDVLLPRILEFNAQEMQLRSFDNVPTFQEFGLLGVAVRCLLWPAFAFSGAFVVISPSLAYIPVAIGSVMTAAYIRLAAGRITLPLSLLLSAMLFAAMVTGFTAYIRYIYPLIVIWPLLVVPKRE